MALPYMWSDFAETVPSLPHPILRRRSPSSAGGAAAPELGAGAGGGKALQQALPLATATVLEEGWVETRS
jgi:hypothetical protein